MIPFLARSTNILHASSGDLSVPAPSGGHISTCSCVSTNGSAILLYNCASSLLLVPIRALIAALASYPRPLPHSAQSNSAQMSSPIAIRRASSPASGPESMSSSPSSPTRRSTSRCTGVRRPAQATPRRPPLAPRLQRRHTVRSPIAPSHHTRISQRPQYLSPTRAYTPPPRSSHCAPQGQTHMPKLRRRTSAPRAPPCSRAAVRASTRRSLPSRPAARLHLCLLNRHLHQLPPPTSSRCLRPLCHLRSNV